MKKLIQIVGPSFTNYSYARVNRGLALGLLSQLPDYEIKVVSNQKYAERDPSADDLKRFPELTTLLTDTIDPEGITIYNNFPRDPNSLHGIGDLPGALKLIYIAWERDIYPKQWVNEFNQYADGVICAAEFVRDVMSKSGISVPLFVAWNAIDEKVRTQAAQESFRSPINSQKKFKFLHISSGEPRKGTDILLSAFCSEFSSKDDVALIIKTIPQGINLIPRQIAELGNKDNLPEIEIISRDVDDEELSSLLAMTDASVYPTRAEGFGLPIAEAMLYRKPVIVTGYGAHLDFCNEQTGYLIDYKLELAVQSQLADVGAKWALPSVDDLRRRLREVYEENSQNPLPLNARHKITNAYQTSLQLTWENTATKFRQIIEEVLPIKGLNKVKIAIISPLNTMSGIAEYTDLLHRKIDSSFADVRYFANSDADDLVMIDQEDTVRSWVTGEIEFTQLKSDLQEFSPEIVHIEYHSGNYKPQGCANLISAIRSFVPKIVLTIHSANRGPADLTAHLSELKLVDKVIVHSEIELAKLETAGLTNVQLMVIGNTLITPAPYVQLKESLGLADSYPILVTHGLLTATKGLDQIIQAMAVLKDKYPKITLLAANAVSANNVFAKSEYQKLQDLAKDLNLNNQVIFIPDFLTRAQIMTIISMADQVILAYDDVGEGASGSMQYPIASDKPLIMTDIPMFKLVKDLALLIPNNRAENLIKSIDKLLEDKEEQRRQLQVRGKYVAKQLVQ